MTFRKTSRALLTGTSALALAFAGSVLVASPAAAAALPAANEAELITAINTANANPDLDVITLGGSFTLTADLPDITEDLQIIGTGYAIDGGGFAVFSVDGSATPNIDTTFTDVTINNADYGIVVDDSNVTITDSALDNAPFNLSADGAVVTVTNSSFDNTSEHPGFRLTLNDSSTATITGGTANGNFRNGYQLTSAEGSTITLTGVTANSNNEHGIAVSALDYSTVAVNTSTAEDNGMDGMDGYVWDFSEITVTGSNSNDNVESGFDFFTDSDATATFSGNTAEGNLSRGFDFYSTATSVISTTNDTATDNSDIGFDFYVDGGTVTASDLSGSANDDEGLDAIVVNAGTLSVSDSTFNDSSDNYGVDLTVEDSSTVTLERVVANRNLDGGIRISDVVGTATPSNTVTISDSTFADNTGTGVTIENAASLDTVVQRSTISGNSQIGAGGVDADLGGTSTLSLLNSTVSGNDQATDGAVVVNGEDTAYLTVSHSTIANNTTVQAGEAGGMLVNDVPFTISHSILAGNTGDGVALDLVYNPNAPTTGTIDYSLVQSSAGDALAAVDAGTGNLKNMSAMLDTLADNGGTTLTHLPQDGSPVINAGNPAVTGAPALDQRGNTRVVSTIDLGAVETGVALANTGADATLPLAGGALALGLGVLLLLKRRRLLTR